ncbi:MAG: hypothetical protein GQ545_03965 [Candidatus Aminicenantes bacterium]|nr:hypothetical protein [Candidatus Aminicenantes bacterium]
MNDRHVRDKLSEYIDGMLSQEEASAVKEHLDRCPDCMEEYEEMVKIIGQMNQMESLETPEFFVEKVHERLEKPLPLKKLVKGLFFPLKIKIPLELAGVAAAALLVIYIVGVRGKQHVYELTYAQRSQPLTVLQEQKMEREVEVDEITTLSKKEPPASAPQEKRMERREPDLAHQEEKIDRKAQIGAEATTIANAQRREDFNLEIADKEKGEAEKDVPRMATPREGNLQDIITALGGKIIESEYNKDTQVLESLIIEIPVDNYPKLIKTLEERGEIQKPYPAIKEKDQEVITIQLILQQ